ncbi:Adaptive-response sensory-kinase SasA [bioreactor metagenome]|uniref:histidine kinase n=1 Tax=bioreactor metagenome TaxID=1076179 RepID=A0A645AJT9_9ZZZZ
MKRTIRTRLSLSLFFSMIVFFIFMITGLIIALMSFLAIESGLVQRFGHYNLFVFALILVLGSVIVGTIVSLIFGRFPLRPVHKIIAAFNRLAAGDFSVRLDTTRPPEFVKLAESFNTMAQELGAIEMLRSDFVNNFSHEFKTPIVSIKGFAEMLKRNDLSNEERNEYLSIIISESDRLSSLATNVLMLAKVENQTILSETHTYNLSEQIRRCILLLESKWENKGITFSLDIGEIRFTGNEELLSQVWINLIDNAIKFTPDDGSINLNLRALSGCLEFSIRDSGLGIGEEAARHIFDKSYRADTSNGGTGNGLGLAIAKKIVELHGGTIACSSHQDSGMEFVITLPVM